MFLNSSMIKSIISSMKLMDVDKLVRLITMTGLAWVRDLSADEREFLGNTLMTLGRVVKTSSFSNTTDANMDVEKWLNMADINMEILNIEKKLLCPEAKKMMWL